MNDRHISIRQRQWKFDIDNLFLDTNNLERDKRDFQRGALVEDSPYIFLRQDVLKFRVTF